MVFSIFISWYIFASAKQKKDILVLSAKLTNNTSKLTCRDKKIYF